MTDKKQHGGRRDNTKRRSDDKRQPPQRTVKNITLPDVVAARIRAHLVQHGQTPRAAQVTALVVAAVGEWLKEDEK